MSMADPQITLSEDGATVTIVMPRLTAIAVAAALQQSPLQEVLPVLRAIVGDPVWKRASGEGNDGPIPRPELNEFLFGHNLPIPT
jgi:hypothetical protein